MELVELGQVELTYTSLESLDYGGGGRLYGTMEAAWSANACKASFG